MHVAGRGWRGAQGAPGSAAVCVPWQVWRSMQAVKTCPADSTQVVQRKSGPWGRQMKKQKRGTWLCHMNNETHRNSRATKMEGQSWLALLHSPPPGTVMMPAPASHLSMPWFEASASGRAPAQNRAPRVRRRRVRAPAAPRPRTSRQAGWGPGRGAPLCIWALRRSSAAFSIARRSASADSSARRAFLR